MTTLNFTVGTRIETVWLNDVDALVWDVFGGATTKELAKTALGIGGAGIEDIAALTPTNGNMIVGDGTNWVAEATATLQASIGVSPSDTPDFTGVTFNGIGSTLSSYAEGTFTPTIQDDTRSDAESATYSMQWGKFTKIGDIYFISGAITVSSLGSLTTSEQAVIANFPAAPTVVTNGAWNITVNAISGLAITANQSIVGTIDTGDQAIKLYLWDATTGTTILTLAELTAAGSLTFSGWHHG